jgi:dsRNA-specific ribonuclease
MEAIPIEAYFGKRDESFKNMLKNILQRGNIKPKYIELLLNEDGMRLYSKIFTHSSIDPNNNYEFYETLGDSTANKCIVWYLSRRFPELNCPEGVKVIARLKIHLVSKDTFFAFAQSLNMWPFISAMTDIRQTKMKKVLEDVFEAFIGATELLIDEKIKQGVGYSIVYNIIASILDQVDISLEYEVLFDAKTRLKEIFDKFVKQGIGKLDYEAVRDDKLFTVNAVRILPNGTKQLLSTAKASLKIDAEQKAAEIAIRTLLGMGFEKPVPVEYLKFSRRR